MFFVKYSNLTCRRIFVRGGIFILKSNLGFLSKLYPLANLRVINKLRKYVGEDEVILVCNDHYVVVNASDGYEIDIRREEYSNIIKKKDKYFLEVPKVGNIEVPKYMTIGLRYYLKYIKTRYVYLSKDSNGSIFVFSYGV